jgi:hypothetical protein
VLYYGVLLRSLERPIVRFGRLYKEALPHGCL